LAAGRLWFIKANQMNLAAFLTFFKRMIHKETVKMTLLVGCKDACTFAKGANVLERCRNRGANKLGAVWDSFHGLQKL
jgi:hypothetical protein